MKMNLRLALAIALLCGSHAVGGTVTFVGKTSDVTDFQAAGFGKAGYWFPQFAALSPVTGAALDDNDRNAFPSWIDVSTQALFDDAFDDQATSSGGFDTWNNFKLPSGESGRSGSLVDPGSANNSNNTIDDMILRGDVPSSFLFSVVVDNTNGAHNPARRINARGEDGTDGSNFPVEVDLDTRGEVFNGVADIYTFRYDGFVPEDRIKLRLHSGVAGVPAGFAGLMFDAAPVPEPSGAVAILVVACCLGLVKRKR